MKMLIIVILVAFGHLSNNSFASPPDCTKARGFFTVNECELNRVCTLAKNKKCRKNGLITWARSKNHTDRVRYNERIFLTKRAQLVIPSVSEMDGGDYYFFEESLNGEQSVCDHVCLRVIPERNRVPVDINFNDNISVKGRYLIEWSEWEGCECTHKLNQPSHQMRKGDYGEYYEDKWKSNSNLTSYLQLKSCISDCVIDQKQSFLKTKKIKRKKRRRLRNMDISVGVEKPIQGEFKIVQEGQGVRLSCDIDRTRYNMNTFPSLNVKWQVNRINFSRAGRYHDQELDLLIDDLHRLIILNRTTMTRNKAIFTCYLNDRPKKIIQLSLEWYTDSKKFMTDVKTLGLTIIVPISIAVLIFESYSNKRD